MRISLVVFLTAITGVLGLSNGVDLYLRLSYLLGLILIFSWIWTRYSVYGLVLDLRGSTSQATVGQQASAQLIIYNKSFLPRLSVEVRPETDLPTPWVPHVLHLPASRSRTMQIDFLCERRGRYTIGPTRVTSGDPFGLFRKEVVVGETHSLMVYPATVALTSFALPPADLPGEGRHRRRTHFVTPNAAGVREYAHGDSYNRIHWPSTVRTGKLMVKEFELDPASETWIILDLHAEVQAGEGLQSTEEYGVTVAASVAKHYLEANRPIGFISYGNYLEINYPDRSGHQLVEIMEWLALARADGSIPMAELLASEASRFGRFSTLLVITPSTDETWVQQLQHLMRRGARISTVLLEPSTFGGPNNTLPTVGALLATGVQTHLVKRGASIQEALSAVEGAADTRPAT